MKCTRRDRNTQHLPPKALANIYFTTVLLMAVHATSGQIAMFNRSPYVNKTDASTDIVCVDLSKSLPRLQTRLRRSFNWHNYLETGETFAESILNASAFLYNWGGNDIEKAVGAFTCGRGDLKIHTVKMHQNASLFPEKFSKSVAQGYKIHIRMLSRRKGQSRQVVWLKNGKQMDIKTSSRMWIVESDRTLVIHPVYSTDEGVYSAYYDDEPAYMAASTILLVRSCVSNKWSKHCNTSCPVCLNGGQCSDVTGRCVCPGSFHGNHCEEACQPGYFGNNCEYNCNDLNPNLPRQTDDMSCKGVQMCTTGHCTCMSGWMGPSCRKGCPQGKYGPDCSLNCMCNNGGTCDKYRGCICTEQWKGVSCKIPKRVSLTKITPTPVYTYQAQDDSSRIYDEQSPNITRLEATPSFNVNNNQMVQISCSSNGSPLPGHGEIMLQRGSTDISPSRTTISATETTSLFSCKISSSYPGPFICVAKTIAGVSKWSFNFTIMKLPVPIHAPKLVSSTSTSLQLILSSKSYTGDGPINATILLMQQEGEPSFRDISIKSNDNDSLLMDGLKPYTTYTFRVVLYRVGGDSGRGPPGPVATFKTNCGVPLKPPSIKRIYPLDNTTLYIQWENPTDEEVRGDVEGYDIRYRKEGSNHWLPLRIKYRSTSTTLKMLTPQAVYDVSIRLYNCAGYSPYSTEIKKLVGTLEKPIGPQFLGINRTSMSITIYWKTPTNAKPITIVNYEVLFQVGSNKSLQQYLFNTTNLHYTFNKLTPYTKYFFAVRAYNHNGPGDFSKKLIGITKEEAPSEPMNVEVKQSLPKQLTVGWEEPLEPNGIITAYDVELRKDGRVLKTLDAGNVYSFTIPDLEEYTEYTIRVRGHTIEPGTWSVFLTASTMSIRPLDAPRNLQVKPISAQSVKVTWLSPAHSALVGNINQYKIIYTDDVRKTNEYWTSKFEGGGSNTTFIDGLRPNTVYFFKISAQTIALGPYSDNKSTRTLRLGLPPPPHHVTIANITHNSAKVCWQIASGYFITTVKMRTRSTQDLEWNELLVDNTQYAIILTDLEQDTKYEVELIAKNYKGYSSGNPTKYFKTKYTDDVQTIGDDVIDFEDSLLFKVLLVVIGAILIVIFILVTILCCRCSKRRRGEEQCSSHLEMDSMRISTFGSSSQGGAVYSRSGTLLSSNSIHSSHSREPSTYSGQIVLPEYLIISWEKIIFEDIPLGEGNFGQVVKAVVQKDNRLLQTAVKMLKDGCSQEDKKDFLAEMEMMVRIGRHRNIISLIGACEQNGSLYLCTEFAMHGNLLQYLRRSRQMDATGGETYTTLSQFQLFQFALDVCQGMAYLCDKQLIHRDLAARNILLGDGLCAKVGDFGLSRGEGVYVKKTVARLPIRWMAIESLNYNVYTTKSDVWSFGVLLWEIVSLGGTPYCGMSCAELYEKLPTGYRMEKPMNCDDEVYKLMTQCWKDRPYERPTFSQLCVALARMTDARNSRNYVNTAIFENFSFANIDANEEEG